MKRLRPPSFTTSTGAGREGNGYDHGNSGSVSGSVVAFVANELSKEQARRREIKGGTNYDFSQIDGGKDHGTHNHQGHEQRGVPQLNERANTGGGSEKEMLVNIEELAIHLSAFREKISAFENAGSCNANDESQESAPSTAAANKRRS
jgi:hypothetical protein